jgi:K+-transporting ATPase KdpF subunit
MYEAIREACRAYCAHQLNAPLVTGGPGSLIGATSSSLRAPEHLMISVENLIGLIGGIALVVYLVIALTRPEWF